MEALIPIVVVALIVAVASLRWTYFRTEKILARWARDNDYSILSAEFRWFRRGPFFWWTSRGQEVFYVTVRTTEGRRRRGWVRCGGFIFGVLVNRAEVRWDD